MIELLVLPAWNAPPTTLDDWSSALSAQGYPVLVDREPDGVIWLEVAILRLRGYVELEEGQVTAVNFELHDPDPSAATEAIETAAKALGWEVYPDDGEEEDE